MRTLTVLLIVTAALAVSACAGVSEKRAPTEVDKDYVGAVESQARLSGVDVQWVNPPRQNRTTEEEG
jgi:uncharacterized protein YceK